MQVQPRVECVLVAHVDGAGIVARNMAVAHIFSDHAGVFALRQGVVVTVSGARFGLLDSELLKQFGHPPINVLAPIVGMKASDDERELSVFLIAAP